MSATSKTRDMHNHHMDSTVWDELRLRDDDIVVATYAKSGTTWTQQIVGQLIFCRCRKTCRCTNCRPGSTCACRRNPSSSPPSTRRPTGASSRRICRWTRSSSPTEAKYIYLGRDGRDVIWSLYNHHVRANDALVQALNDTPGRVGPPIERPIATTSAVLSRVAREGRPSRSGPSGRTCAAGGRSATFPTSCCSTSPS